MIKNIILSPHISRHTPQPVVGAIDKNISFYCQGVNYNNKEIEIIILDGKNARDDVVGFYLVKKCLLDFYIHDEIEEMGEDTLSFSNYDLKGFFKGSLTFQVLSISDTRDNMLKIQVADNLFSSSSQILLLPKNNERVKNILLPYQKTWREHDSDIGTEVLKTDWSLIVDKTFTIENIDGEKCYFENDCLVLNDFGGISEKSATTNSDEEVEIPISPTEERYKKIEKKFLFLLTKSKPELKKKEEIIKVFNKIYYYAIENNFVKMSEYVQKWKEEWGKIEELILLLKHNGLGCYLIKAEQISFLFNTLRQFYELEKKLDKTKKLLVQKDQEIEKFKDKNSEEYQQEKEDLIQQLNQANQRIKELEEYKTKTEKELKDLYNYAKNSSSSGSPNQPNNNSNLKVQLTKLQQEQQEWKNKLAEEEKKNKDLETQIKNYRSQNNISSKTVWETIKKPLLIGGIIAGGLFLLFIIYKRFIAKHLN